ncbi:UNVERIFIED_CONTAM: hypothetical protein O8I53_13210 [Campylobacter lari]
MNLKIKNKISLNKRSLLILPYVLIAILLVFVPIILIVINAFLYTGDSAIDSTTLIRQTET